MRTRASCCAWTSRARRHCDAPARRCPRARSRHRAQETWRRLAVTLALRDGGELCVCDLAWVCERSDKLVSHHARLLRSAGLVYSRRERKMVLCALTDRGRRLLEATIFDMPVQATP